MKTTLLNDRYRLTERIAVGGMGEVWRARDEVLDRDVAVKLLKSEYLSDPSFLERFRAEARHAAALSHPGIAGVFDYGETDGAAFLVMELVRGDPLSAVLATEGRLPPDRTLAIVAQAARALEVAHQSGVVHRDVKPGNILVCPDGTVKLTDFGIARAANAVPLTRTGVVLGTAYYVAPEQANGRAVTYASDVYSLGVVAYECLAGRRPFEAETPVAVAMGHLYEDPLALPDDVPEAVSGLVARAMAKDPAARYPSAAAFAQAADAVLAGVAPSADPASAASDSSTTTAMTAPAAADSSLTTSMSAPGASGDAPPTLALPTVGGTGAAAGSPARRRLRDRWVVALAAFLVLLLVVAVWGALRPPPKRSVPRLAGLDRAAATARLDRLGLDLVEKTAYSDSVARGRVIRQDPEPGTTLREGDDVSVTISRGRQPVTLPDGLVGRQLLDVVGRLEKLGLKVTRVAQASDALFGTVTSVRPTTGLHRGDTVTVTYSLGKDDDDKGNGKGKGKGDDD